MNQSERAVFPMLLTQLHLPTMKRLWEDLAVDAEEKGWSCPHYLSLLCDYEVAERHRRRLSRHMLESQLPKGKSLESYDFGTISGVTKQKILGLSSGELWVKGGMC